jgi:hypothetical protein
MKNVYVTFNNTDLTEGRGNQIPTAVCEIKATAIRIGKNSNVQGSDATIKTVPLEEIGGIYYIPIQYVPIYKPTIHDFKQQEILDKKQVVIDKAISAGLTKEDLIVLSQQDVK